MDKKELGGSVARQVRRIALSLFEFTEGAASFEERKCAIPLDYMVSLSLHRILHDGIRSMPERELVLAGLGNLDRSVVMAPVPPFPFEKKRSAEEKEILEMAQRKVTLRRLGWASGGLAFSRLRTVYAFLAAGILQEPDGGKASPQPVVHMETGTFLLSALQRQPDPTGQEAVHLEIQDELERSAHLDREAWLKVASTAPREQLLKALEEKMERYHALREAIGEDEQLKTDIEVILGRASAMLRLARQTPPPGAPSKAAPAAKAARAGAPAANSAAAPPVKAAPPPAVEEEDEEDILIEEEDEDEVLPDVEVEEDEDEIAAEEPAITPPDPPQVEDVPTFTPVDEPLEPAE
jgi:hypothetical protein